MPRKTCKNCGRFLGVKVHICSNVEEKGTRYCKQCSKKLKNKGWERYSKICGKCGKIKYRQTERLFRKTLRALFGGKCKRCGYSKCSAALHFHHIDGRIHKPNKPGKVSLREVAEHPERFELLCANCHIEEHNPDKID